MCKINNFVFCLSEGLTMLLLQFVYKIFFDNILHLECDLKA